MAKPNYSFEKRQRELAKRRKKEDKAAKKSANGGEEQNPNEAAMSLIEDSSPAPATPDPVETGTKPAGSA